MRRVDLPCNGVNTVEVVIKYYLLTVLADVLIVQFRFVSLKMMMMMTVSVVLANEWRPVRCFINGC